MFNSRIANAFALSALAAALLGHAGLAAAQTTGGTTTKTLEYRGSGVTTAAETLTVETYSTQVLGFLAGNPTALVDVQFVLPFGDAAVQAAFATTQSILAAASVNPLSFSGPTLTSSSRVLSNASSTVSEVLTGQEVLWVETVELVGEELFHLNSAQFGCVAVVQGDHVQLQRGLWRHLRCCRRHGSAHFCRHCRLPAADHGDHRDLPQHGRV
jgi:hypothetical protein